MTRASIAIFACLAAAPASANVWQQAIERKEPDLARVLYEDTMGQGDDALELATASDVSEEQEAKWVQRAVDEYRQAAKARPDSAEPWFRIADALYHAYLDESEDGSALHRIPGTRFDRPHALEVVNAWNEAEKRSPLDPRFGVMNDIVGTMMGIQQDLFDRAILETKLIDGADPNETQQCLRAAARDYEKILARSEVGVERNETTLGNLAETYMMLGELDKSIDTYRAAYRMRSQSTTTYGLAVALDRADQSIAALDLIKQEGDVARREFFQKVATHEVFFVPDGEGYYYRALIYEAYGADDDAIVMWRDYIASGAHPEYQPRARQHLAELLAHKPKPMDFDDDR
jgi:tetratricopeptide (TPR) repeat protein